MLSPMADRTSQLIGARLKRAEGHPIHSASARVPVCERFISYKALNTEPSLAPFML